MTIQTLRNLALHELPRMRVRMALLTLVRLAAREALVETAQLGVMARGALQVPVWILKCKTTGSMQQDREFRLLLHKRLIAFHMAKRTTQPIEISLPGAAQERGGVRGVVAIRTSTNMGRTLFGPDCFHRVCSLRFVALHATQLPMGAFEQQRFSMIKIGKRLETLLAMAIRTARLHGPTVRVVMAGGAVLLKADVAVLPFGQQDHIGVHMAFGTVELGMRSSQLILHHFVIEIRHVLNARDQEGACIDKRRSRAVMFTMAKGARALNLRSQGAVQAFPRADVLADGAVTFKARLVGRNSGFPMALAARIGSHQFVHTPVNFAQNPRPAAFHVFCHESDHAQAGSQGNDDVRIDCFHGLPPAGSPEVLNP